MFGDALNSKMVGSRGFYEMKEMKIVHMIANGKRVMLIRCDDHDVPFVLSITVEKGVETEFIRQHLKLAWENHHLNYHGRS